MNKQDHATLHALAGRYSEIAHLDIQRERIDRYYRTNNRENVRPVVLISEVPWGEIRDDALTNTCSKEYAWIEEHLRRSLYQWEHFQVDLVITPFFRVTKQIRSTGIGLSVQDVQLKADTGTAIASHEYKDQLQTEDDLRNLRIPEITYEKDGTERALQQANEVFAGLLPVKLGGHAFSCNLWDDISRYRGVENLLMDMAVRPEFMHETVRRFAAIAAAVFRQYIDLDVLDPHLELLHCTTACARDLPAPDFTGKVRPKDIWGRCAAQIFGSVSPEMHDAFDLAYNQKLFGECGLLYYGCCEPLDTKIDILRKRFKNLRKISITPWADPERAARNIGRDYVLAAKPNPAFVSSPTFDPAPVEQEIARVLDACRRYGTTCEFVLKDISTIGNNPVNLTQWAATVKRVVDRFY